MFVLTIYTKEQIMKYLKGLIKRMTKSTQVQTSSCVDFHDGSVHKQSIKAINCIKQGDNNELRICCARA